MASTEWTAADGQRRQCGTRNVNSDLVLDTFCHATTRYIQTNGSWNAVASPASWAAVVSNGTYDVTVTVGDASSNPSDVAHSVQAEGMIVLDRVPTTNASRFATATITVTVTDGQLDLTFVGGTKTKIVSVELQPARVGYDHNCPTDNDDDFDNYCSDYNGFDDHLTNHSPVIDRCRPATRFDTTSQTANLPSSAVAAGWMLAEGDLFDGSIGWVTDDGQRRQCGTPRTRTLTRFSTPSVTQTTRYSNPNGVWVATDSPATWRVVVPNGTYVVTVTVGDASSSPSAVRHSVQVEGVAIHDRAITTRGAPFQTADAVVVVSDGVADVSFDGGTRTKIVSIELTPVS